MLCFGLFVLLSMSSSRSKTFEPSWWINNIGDQLITKQG